MLSWEGGEEPIKTLAVLGGLVLLEGFKEA